MAREFNTVFAATAMERVKIYKKQKVPKIKIYDKEQNLL